MTAWLTFRGPGARVDTSVFDWSVSHRPRLVMGADKWVASFGSPLVMPVALLLVSLVVACRERSWAPVRTSLVVIAVLVVAVLLTKNLFARPGPGMPVPTGASRHALLQGPDSHWAFPSGHATTALVTWSTGVRMILGDRASGRSRLITPSVVGAMVSVVLVTGGIHWLTDVLAAWPFAVLIGLVSARVADCHPGRAIRRRRRGQQQVQAV